MDTNTSPDQYHRTHKFVLPSENDQILSPLTGTIYEIGTSLNQGNFGHVFECKDEWGNDSVAKVIKPIGAFEETEEKAFFEVLAATIVRCPHIVHTADTFIYRGANYIISERCDFTLRHIIANQQSRSENWLFALMKAILQAIHWVHAQGLAHCDIHAGNVFLKFIPDALEPSQNENAAMAFKLGDFGLTRPVDEMDPSGTFLNCIRPPEALDPLEFGILDHRSDIYQAGLLFLNYMSGEEHVFNDNEILSGRPREFAETYPSIYAPVIAYMLRRHVNSRPVTALEAWRLLSSLAQPH